MPEPLDSLQPVNIERVPESRATRQMRDDQEDFYPHLERRKQKKENDKEKNAHQEKAKPQEDTYEHATPDQKEKSAKVLPENQAKGNKSDDLEGPGFVLDIKV